MTSRHGRGPAPRSCRLVSDPGRRRERPHRSGASMLLEARHISKRFPGVNALQDVSISLQAGEIHAVVGENGAGKSTLMGVLIGLTRPDSGSILVDFQGGGPGEPRRRPEPRHRHRPPGDQPRPDAVGDGERVPGPRAPDAGEQGHQLDGHRAADAGDPGPDRGRDGPEDEDQGPLDRAASARADRPRLRVRGPRPHPGRADGQPDHPGERQPVPDRPGPPVDGRRGLLHLAPAGGDQGDLQPDHGPQGRPEGRGARARRRPPSPR